MLTTTYIQETHRLSMLETFGFILKSLEVNFKQKLYWELFISSSNL